MKKIFNTGLLIFTGLFLYVFSYAETLSISGRITQFTTSSLSLHNIVIDVKGTQNLKVKTSRTGTYIIPNLQKGGTYTLSVSKQGYTFSPSTKVFKNLEESQINQNFVASLATYSISGKVMVGGKPVRDVIVMINNRPIKYYTDQDGAYVIDNLEYNGPYEVKVISEKHQFKPFQIDYLEENVIHDFTKDITVSGRVTSLGKGVENIDININGSIYKTDSDGYYKIDSLVAGGDYVISVVEEKYNPSPKSIPVTKVTGDKENLDFTISGEITGKVTYNGQPFRNAIVKINDRQQEYKTNAQGVYKITNVGLNQEYTVTVSSSGYSFTPRQATVQSIIKENPPLNFKAGGMKYDVTVQAQQGEKPLDKVNIVVNNDLTYKTDKDGTCIISLEHNKKYTFRAVKYGNVFVENIQTIDKLSKDETIIFKSFLDVSGKVEIDGKGLFNAVVTCNGKSAKTNKAGIYTLKNLQPDRNYVIKVSSGNYFFEPEQIIIENLSDSYKDKNFVVRTGNVITGHNDDGVVLKENKKKADKEEKAKLKMQQRGKDTDIDLNVSQSSLKDEKARLKAEREEAERLAKEEELNAKLELEAEQKRLKEEVLQKKMEEAEQKKLEKELKVQAALQARQEAEAEKARLKAEKEEADRLAKEEQLRLKLEAEEAKARLKAEREEAERLAKEEELNAKLELEAEQKRLKEEVLQKKMEEAEQKKLEKELKVQAALQARQEAEAEKARLKAEKEEADRLAKEEQLRLKLEAEEVKARLKAEKAEKARLAKEEKARLKAEEIEKEAKLREEIRKKFADQAEQKKLKTTSVTADSKPTASSAAVPSISSSANITRETKKEAHELDEEDLYLEDDILSKPLTDEERKMLYKDYEEQKKKEEAEQKKLEKEAKIKAAQEAKEQAEAEKARLKAEKLEAERLAQEEKAKLKAEKEEADRLAKEEQQRLKQEEEQRKAEEAEQKRLEKEAKIQAEREAKEQAEAEKAKIKAEKEEADRIAKEEQLRLKLEAEEAKTKLRTEKSVSSDIDAKIGTLKPETVSIEGRVLKSKEGVKGVQVRLLLSDEERIYLTDKNGFYKIPGLEKGKNYLITVLSGKETLNLSPKSRTYKNLVSDMKNQNFYVIEKIKIATRQQDDNEADNAATPSDNRNGGWHSKYGFENKGGIIQKDIHW